MDNYSLYIYFNHIHENYSKYDLLVLIIKAKSEQKNMLPLQQVITSIHINKKFSIDTRSFTEEIILMF